MYSLTNSTELVNNDDLFMKEFKRYRQLNDSKQNEEIINFDNAENIEKYLNNKVIQKVCFNLINFLNVTAENCHYLLVLKKSLINVAETNSLDSLLSSYGLRQPSEWTCYEVMSNPGLFVIPNPFLPGYQRYLVKKCLAEYHDLPNKTNLDLHIKRDKNMWEDSQMLAVF